MTPRTTAMILGLATLAGGCTVAPYHEHEVVRVESHERRVVYADDAYDGYYYVRIVYVSGVPWYVDDDLRARPLPPHLRSHFRYDTWSRSLPPRFGDDDGMRDGYRLSRIVYIDGVPHHIDDGRHARPIPSRLRSRFAYESVAWRDDRRPRPGERAEPPYPRGGREARPAAYGRAHDESPGYRADRAPRAEMPPRGVRESETPFPPAYPRERDEPSFGRGDALGRAAERAREAARPQPPVYVRDAGPSVYEAAREPDRGMRDARGAQPGVERAGRDDWRAAQGAGQRDGRAAGDGRSRETGAAGGPERRADARADRKGGKGRGRPDGEGADDANARDDDVRGRGRRGD